MDLMKWSQKCEDPQYLISVAAAYKAYANEDWWIDFNCRLADLAGKYHDAVMGKGPLHTMEPEKREAARVAHNVILQIMSIPMQVQEMAMRREAMVREGTETAPEFPGMW